LQSAAHAAPTSLSEVLAIDAATRNQARSRLVL
jgi:hypothetical protein